VSESPSSVRRPSDLPLRAVAGLAMIAVALTALTVGGLLFWLLCAVAAVFMMGEWAELGHTPSNHKRLGQYALFVPLALMSSWGAGPGFLALGLLAGAAFFLVIVTGRRMLASGVLYVGLPVFALLLIREQQPDGLIYALWALALVWACDIGAYFSGRTFGGPKLAPAISPNKTWAGLIGGVILASVFGALMHHFYGLPIRLAVATPLLAVLAVLGDLYESWLKRRAGVKDSGTMLPGHGGVLDRLDGLVPVAPVAAVIVVLPLLLR
jgi:phosphatidate cytidylyltransferase